LGRETERERDRTEENDKAHIFLTMGGKRETTFCSLITVRVPEEMSSESSLEY
jgi:hypothetical protein